MLAPVKRSRVFEHVVEQIRGLVAEGKLRPGDQLPPERELANLLAVSRASVREALRALEVQGLISGKQGGGTFIRKMSPEVLAPRLADAAPGTRQSIKEILEIRELIEPGVARLAAVRATPKLIADMEEQCERHR